MSIRSAEPSEIPRGVVCVASVNPVRAGFAAIDAIRPDASVSGLDDARPLPDLTLKEVLSHYVDEIGMQTAQDRNRAEVRRKCRALMGLVGDMRLKTAAKCGVRIARTEEFVRGGLLDEACLESSTKAASELLLLENSTGVGFNHGHGRPSVSSPRFRSNAIRAILNTNKISE